MSAKLIASVNSVSAVALNHACDWYRAAVRSNEPVEPKQMFDGRPSAKLRGTRREQQRIATVDNHAWPHSSVG